MRRSVASLKSRPRRHAIIVWRGEEDAGEYADIAGFCKSATLEEVRKHGHVLMPGRYVGAEVQEDDSEPFDVSCDPPAALSS